MKKLLWWLLVVVMSVGMIGILSLQGCKEETPEEVTEEEVTEEEVEEVTEEEVTEEVVAEEEELYVFVGLGWVHEVWQYGAYGAIKAGEDLGVNVEIAGPTEVDMDEFISTVETIIAKNPTGIMSLPFEAGEGELLTDYYNNGGLTAAWLKKTENWPATVTVGPDFTEQAIDIVNWMIELREEQGKDLNFKMAIGSITGESAMEERKAAILEEIKKYPGIEWVPPIIEEGNSPEEAIANATAYVAANPDVDVYLSLPSLTSSALVRAIKEAGYAPGEKILLSTDWTDEFAQGMRDGYAQGGMVFSFAIEAYYCIDIMHKIHNKLITLTTEVDEKYGYIPAPIYLQSRTYRITSPENADDFQIPKTEF